VQRRGESPTWNGVEGGCKPVCTSAARKTGDTPCARQEQRSSGGLVSLLGAERMNRFQGRRCGQEQARCGGWRRTRTCGRSQGGRPSSLRKTIYGRPASGITEWAGNMIHARWMNELELGPPFRTPPDLMLELSKKLELDSIFNPAERMVGEKMAQLDHLRQELILKTGWRRVGSFRSVSGSTSLPCLVRWP